MADLDLADPVRTMLKAAAKRSDIRQAEGYASRNSVTLARIETLRSGGTARGPAMMQLASLDSAAAGVTIVIGQSVGRAATSYLTKDALEDLVDTAYRLAKAAPPDPDFKSLATPVKRSAAKLPVDRAILDGSPGDALARQAAAAIHEVDRKDLDLAGSIMAVAEEVSVANTEGIEVRRTVDTFAVAALTAERMEGSEVASSGVGWSSGRTLKQMDAALAARDALSLARLKPQRKSVPEGDYNAILGPYSVGDILYNQFCSQSTLGRVYYGISWLPTKVKKTKQRRLNWPEEGKRIAHPSITIVDDPTLPDAMASKSFDDEGVPTKRTTLVEGGVLKGLLSSSYYANIYGRGTTGHGFRFGATPGRIAGGEPSPNATNTVMKTGDWSLDEMVAEAEGPTIYIPRTWYTYPLRYGGTGFSSSNRSTSFVVEKGELVSIAPNAFKLLGDISTMLKEVRGVGKEAKVATTWAATNACIVPPILTGGARVERPGESSGGR